MVKKNKNLILILAHLIAWVCFFSLPFIFRLRTRLIPQTDNMIVSYVIISLCLFIFYYLNTSVLIPKLFKPKRWLLYLSCVLACFIIFMFAPKPIANAIAPPESADEFYSSRNLPKPPDAEAEFEKRKNITHYPSSYFGFVLVFLVGLVVTSIQEWSKSEETKKEMEREKLNTELSLLRSQINPHFFFNTLNNIYSLAIIKSDETAASILKLSSIMRYVLTETDKEVVPISNEIEFLQNYINLQSVRLTDKVKMDVDINPAGADKQVAPLLLIAFVENAFKYGVSTIEPSFITIRLTTEGNTLQFFVENHIVQAAKSSTVNTGIGIANVKRRLELLYPGKHRLTITEKNDLYTVNLEIYLA